MRMRAKPAKYYDGVSPLEARENRAAGTPDVHVPTNHKPRTRVRIVTRLGV